MNRVNESDIFRKRYKALNAAQKQAVDTIDGPVMVIAGPGTGKTELLSLRVANILKQTDMLAENILCLTFTESGASAMQERLISLMGKDAYHVAIHTFHGFGSEIIAKYSDYFYSGANFRPADELTTYEILHDIFSKLPHNNPLSAKLNGEFTYLKNVQNTISDFKRSGLTPDEIQRVLHNNQAFLEQIEPLLQKFFSRPIRKSMLDELEALQADISAYSSPPSDIPNITPLDEVLQKSLATAIDTAQTTQKTTALTAWRNAWLEKNAKGDFVCKDRTRAKKLVAASYIYNEYLNAMQNAQVYDYDDMILRLVHALEVFPELKFSLQEQYQYIMVDEFQDTNGAQMRILLSLTDNPTQNGRPNILIVGDDDQAIYSFQGAEVSNILTFKKQFKNPAVITLTENYRSAPVILDHARSIITQGSERLESVLNTIDKTPKPTISHSDSIVELIEFPTPSDELSSIAEIITKELKQGKDPGDIAIIARNHRDIKRLVPYLIHKEIPFSYEHRENILEQPPVELLIELAQIVVWISNGDIDKLDAHLPKLLAHPAWQLSPQDIWQISLTSYKNRQTWLETMQQTKGQTQEIANTLISLAQQTLNQPLEMSLDQLFGTRALSVEKGEYIMPFKEYFFGVEHLDSQSITYVSYLQSLVSLRQLIRDYRPDEAITIKDFVAFIDMSKKAKINVTLTTDSSHQRQAVQVMTAHKAKGLEFDTVFIINSTDQTWGNKSRGRHNRLAYPANIQIAPPGDTEDERLRLFFVALTRAKYRAFVSYTKEDISGKPCLKASFLQTDPWHAREASKRDREDNELEAVENTWQETIVIPRGSLKTALEPYLEHYQLSATHLNTFIDVTIGGPRAFLLENLLHFPTSPHPNAALGSAIHASLRRAHEHLSATGERKPVEDIIYDFESQLKLQRLATDDFTYQLQKGGEALTAYLEKNYQNFNAHQVGERDFRNQGVVLGEALLTGVIDVMSVNTEEKTISVIDYKTGKPASTWRGSSDFEKIKLHKYRQQLMFYKLLAEHSRDYKNYTVNEACLEFIEPDAEGNVHHLKLDVEPEELARFEKLIAVVWRHIKSADFIDTSHYEQSYKGILAFEEDLIKI